ncbi:uncharacterized protein [Dysidea avara]|uniref:uncharacterized protein n=1 Tax=Dysidea avara TaxID=196820 RepID=UPI00332DA485
MSHDDSYGPQLYIPAGCSGEVARPSGQFLRWQQSKTALDDLWRMTSGHSSSAINEVQFLVKPLSSTGCQCTISAVLHFLQWQLLPLKNLVVTICGQFCSFFTELFNVI